MDRLFSMRFLISAGKCAFCAVWIGVMATVVVHKHHLFGTDFGKNRPSAHATAGKQAYFSKERLISYDWPFAGEPAWKFLLDPAFIQAETTYRDTIPELLQHQFGHAGLINECHGMLICTAPGAPQSNMDIPICLSLHEVSTWTALRHLVQQMQCNLVTDQFINLRLLMYRDACWPPEFTECECITVCVDNRPAREVLCEILSQAPFPLRFVYAHKVNRGKVEPWLYLRAAEYYYSNAPPEPVYQKDQDDSWRRRSGRENNAVLQEVAVPDQDDQEIMPL